MRILRLFIIAAIVITAGRMSVFGWRFTPVYGGTAMDEEHLELVRNLKTHVRALSDEIGDRSVFEYQNLLDAERYVTRVLESYGYGVEFQEYHVSGRTVRNIIAAKPGREKPDETVILGAHYDTCFNPGADDNASGVAGLLELARLLAAEEPARTLKFIAFVNEEPPFFKTDHMGSLVYARRAKERGEDIRGAVILEMIGYYSNEKFSQRYPAFFGFFYPNRGNFICMVGNINSRSLTRKATKTFREHSDFPLETFTGPGFIVGVDFSDHWSFWEQGYPAIMVTDMGFYRNPNYHTQSDTWETLDYESMARVVSGLKFVLLRLANE